MSLINYDELIKNSLRSVVSQSLKHVEKKGLSGKQHLYITFCTYASGVQIPEYLQDEYPEELTIVLQNQFWNLFVTEESFTVSLNFNSSIETVCIPFSAILEFSDPSEDFVLQFEEVMDMDDLSFQPTKKDEKEDINISEKVVSLDQFRKNRE